MTDKKTPHRGFAISSRTRYALLILFELAVAPPDQPRSLREIAEAHDLSKKYLSRLVIPLREAGFIASIPGPKGGFRLLQPPGKITMLGIVEVMDGPVSIFDCVADADACAHSGDCVVLGTWNRLNSRIRKAMRSVTLGELIREKKRGGAVFSLLKTALPPTRRTPAKNAKKKPQAKKRRSRQEE